MNKSNGTSDERRNAESQSGKEAEPGFMSDLPGHLKVSIIATLTLAVVVSGLYPAVVWGLAQVLFHDKANGSLIGKDGKPVSKDQDAVGSALLGQSFADAKYFHPRPSAAGSGYDATASGGSNLGPTSAKLMYGTTKLVAYTVFAADKPQTAVVPVGGRVQGTVAGVTKTTITVTAPGAAANTKTTYALDPAVADPNTVVNFHGRTIHPTTIVPGALVELKLNDKAPPAVTTINVVDQETDGAPASVDATANKITLNDTSSTVINVDPKNTVFVVNGKADAKVDAITTNMTIHAIVSMQMDYDGIADRVIHYCQDNKIDYKSSVPDSAFADADGVDDAKLIAAFNAASNPNITPDPTKPVPADAVTASGSGLDPHISPANAELQKGRVAQARGIRPEQIQELIDKHTDRPDLGVLGDPGVNVLMLNLALDAKYAIPAPPTTQPSTAPKTMAASSATPTP